MSMHLVGPALTTTNYNKKKKKVTNKRLAEAQERHNEWLKKRGLDDKSLAEKLQKDKRGRRKGIYDIPDYSVKRVTSDSIPDSGVAREQLKYTGDEIMGITLNHKSNFEPVRRDNRQAAIDSARMRR